MMRGLLTILIGVTGLVLVFGQEEEMILNAGDSTKYIGCEDLMVRGSYMYDGPYRVYLNGSPEAVEIYCRFSNQVASTMILLRTNWKEDFNRTYQQYMYPFGSTVLGNLWFGLIRIKDLTDEGNTVLTLRMQDCNNDTKTVRCSRFSLGPWTQQFPLSVKDCTSSNVFPYDITYNDGFKFSTFDKPDKYNCAGTKSVGWWYNSHPPHISPLCTLALPTGVYKHPCGTYSSPYNGIFYNSWHGRTYSLKRFEMLLSKS